MTMTIRPERSEAAEYYFTYIDLVPSGDICATLEAQLADAMALFGRVPADRVDYRYADGKWTIREVLSHLNDTERLFAFRAFWFARGFDSPLPSFDQHLAASHANAERRPWAAHVDEFRALRTSTIHLFRQLSPEAWLRRGVASDNPFSVRALAYLAAGHVTHHATILRERYLQ
jgi:hypothetical protein